MKKLLFEEAFTKAENQTGNNTKHGLSNHLEGIFTEDLKFPINKITFVRYYEKYIENDTSITNNPNSDLLNNLSVYLDFKSYEDFVSANSGKEKNKPKVHVDNENGENLKMTIQTIIRRNKIFIIITSVLVACLFIYNSVTKQRFMVWQEDHYKEVRFDIEEYDINQLKIYKEDRIKYFMKIKPTCDYKFFNKDESVRVWYEKSKNKELEYFTDLGLHPETGKTLKPITRYMIDKYICDK